MIGDVFGEWTVIEEIKKPNQVNLHWLCECKCGFQKIIQGSHLRSGKEKMCFQCKKDHIKKNYNWKPPKKHPKFSSPDKINHNIRITAAAEEMLQEIMQDQALHEEASSISEVIELCIRTAYEELI